MRSVTSFFQKNPSCVLIAIPSSVSTVWIEVAPTLIRSVARTSRPLTIFTSVYLLEATSSPSVSPLQFHFHLKKKAMEGDHSTSMKTEKLTEGNFYAWRQKIQHILALRNLDDFIEDDNVCPRRTGENGEEVATWLKKDKKARAIIGRSLSDELLENLRDTATGRSMWTSIQAILNLTHCSTSCHQGANSTQLQCFQAKESCSSPTVSIFFLQH